MVHYFENDDRRYMEWMRTHPTGYVLVSWNPPRADKTTVHRADCTSISPAKYAGKSLTVSYIKVCAESFEGIERWASVEFGEGHEPLYLCRNCQKAGRL